MTSGGYIEIQSCILNALIDWVVNKAGRKSVKTRERKVREGKEAISAKKMNKGKQDASPRNA
ncbi:hypothetical protein AU510_08780 [Lonsdalea britannica]|nr:hypothetical protein AU510_08780 [Lonsdalea britannica]